MKFNNFIRIENMFNLHKKTSSETLSTENNIPQKTSPNIFNPVETDIKLIGNQETIVQIIALLSYIRNLINTQTVGEIKVSVGKNINSDFFAMSVNNQEIADLKAKKEIDIN